MNLRNYPSTNSPTNSVNEVAAVQTRKADMNPFKSPPEVATPKSASTTPFRTKSGNSLSRANDLRPMHPTLVELHIMSAICYGALGLICTFGVFSLGNFDPMETIGALIFGAVFLCYSFFLVVILLFNIWHGRRLACMSRDELKYRISTCTKEGRFIASRRELRGFRIGAVFFTISLAVMIIGKFVN